MASVSRRPVSSFNISFLDIMFCGFGAVVLLVLIINSNIITSQQTAIEDRRLEYLKQELVTKQKRNNEKQLQLQSQSLYEALASLEKKQSALSAENAAVQSSIASQAVTSSSEEVIESLQKELKALEKEKLLLEAQKIKESEQGKQIRPFIGQGDRQYLTGLKLGGRRVLLLIDTSASMLDRKIVDIIRRKVLDENIRRSAPKWQKAASTVEWLLAKLPVNSTIQLYGFNSVVTSLAPGQKKSWINITDTSTINQMVEELKQIAPSGGTNLESAFLQARTLVPPPDNIILLTDGLPTQGKRATRAKTISGKERIRLFEQALKQLPKAVPVNTILFPVEGDPMAAVLYWKLAVESGGSFLTPTRDWP